MRESDVDGDLVDGSVDGDLVDCWHQALLALAGVLPDELVTRARGWLARGLRLDLARAVSFALVAGRLAVPDEVRDLLHRESGAAGQDNELLGLLSATPVDGPLTMPWWFCSAEPGGDGLWAFLPLDLTTGSAMSGGEMGDVDLAMIEAVRGEPDTSGLWRAWRLAAGDSPWPRPRRVFVVTVRATSGLAAVTGRLQAALTAAGEPDPQVEVCPAGGEAPAYQVLARTGGALLWAREPATSILVARVFDGVDPQEGPCFAADHPRVDGADRARIAAYLDAGAPVLGTSATMIDVVEPVRGDVVPVTFRTDGRWVWTDTASYYLTTHGLAPDPDLLRHARRAEPPLPVDEVALHRVLAHLLRPEPTELMDAEPGDAEPVWYVPGMGGDARAGVDTRVGRV